MPFVQNSMVFFIENNFVQPLHQESLIRSKNIKRMKSTLYTLLFLGVALQQNNAQSLTGKVVDTNQKPLDGALVSLLKAQDSSLVKTTLTEADGAFEFLNLKDNTYLVSVNLLGFKNYVTDKIVLRGSSFALPTVSMSLETKVLKEVTVTSKIPFIERKVDRTVVNVEAQLSNAGSNALEALERAPGVIVDANGGISLKGKQGVTIFIDDKPTYLAGDALQNYLRALPASALKQIEIMTNPPAKYDAAGNGGVINIITKRNTASGLFGSFSVNYSQGKYARSNNSFNLNYNGKKYSFYTNLSGGIRNSFQDLFINRTYKNSDLTPKSNFNQNSYITNQGFSFNAKMGLDVYLTNKTTLGVVLKGMTSPNESNTANFAIVSNSKRTVQNTVLADNTTNVKFNNGGITLNLRHQFDSTGQQLTFDADYLNYAAHPTQVFLNTVLKADNTLELKDKIKGSLPSTTAIYALKSDYTKPLKHDAKFEAGFKIALTKTDNTADYKDFINNVEKVNYDLTNRFLYDEMINAAYLNYAKSWKRMQVQAGLRAENTVMHGNQLGNGISKPSTFNRDSTNLFPTFYYSYTMDSAGHHQLGFNYGRRIDRPVFKDLNPFASPLDKYTYYAGNPFLTPTFSNNWTLTYSYKSVFSTNLNYSFTRDAIYETLEIDRNGIYFSRPGNVGKTDVVSLDMNLTAPLSKKISSNLYVSTGYNKYVSKLYTEDLNSGGFYWVVQGTMSFQFKDGWSGEVNGQAQSDFVYSQLLIKGFGILNMTVQKKILKNKGNLKLGINDIFYSRIADGIINNLRLTDADWNSSLDTRQAALTFSYNFGKASKGKNRYNGSGSESEQKRVRM
jgi:outer membrane receptor protein involved in Fe transport